MTELAALNIKINGDSADLQSDIAKAKSQLSSFERQTTKATRGAAGFSGSLSRLGNVSGSARAKIQNTSFQLQDIAVQLQGGTKASTVFAQQLPQLLGGFGALGAVAGVLAGVGIPALAFAFAAAGDEVVDTDEAIDNFIGSLNSVTEAFNIAKTPLSDLREEFGKFAEQVRQAAILNAQASLSLGLEGLAGAVSVIQGPLDDVTSKLLDYGQAVNELNIVQQTLGERTISNASAFDEAQAKVDAARASVVQAAEAMGMSANEAMQLQAALRNLSEAESMEDVATQAAKALELLRAMFPPTEKIPPEIAKIVAELEAVLRAASAGVTALNSMGDAAANAAAKTAAAARSARAAAYGSLGQAITQGPSGLLPQANVPFPSEQGEIVNAPKSVGGGVGGGGGGGGAVNPIVAQLESVQSALMTQEEAQIASFERQQETLQQALEQRLLTQQEYNALIEEAQAQHADRMTAIDVYRYGSNLDKTEQFLGDMASAFQSGNEKMLKIAKVFGAAQALVSAFQGAAEALKLPFPANLAAFAKVLATGLGAVQAIKGVSSSGGGGAAGGAVAAGAAGGAAAQPQVSRNVAISLTGGDMFSRDQVINLINNINEAVEDGAVVRLV